MDLFRERLVGGLVGVAVLRVGVEGLDAARAGVGEPRGSAGGGGAFGGLVPTEGRYGVVEFGNDGRGFSPGVA